MSSCNNYRKSIICILHTTKPGSNKNHLVIRGQKQVKYSVSTIPFILIKILYINKSCNSRANFISKKNPNNCNMHNLESLGRIIVWWRIGAVIVGLYSLNRLGFDWNLLFFSYIVHLIYLFISCN